MRMIALLLLVVSIKSWASRYECNHPNKKFFVKIEEFSGKKDGEIRFSNKNITFKKCNLNFAVKKSIRNKTVSYYDHNNCIDYVQNKIELKPRINLTMIEAANSISYYIHFDTSTDGIPCSKK